MPPVFEIKLRIWVVSSLEVQLDVDIRAPGAGSGQRSRWAPRYGGVLINRIALSGSPGIGCGPR